MNLLQLRYFQSVAKHENFTKAAQELFVSQPALSQMVRQLEEELDVTLFDRIGKKIRLNEAGTIYLSYVDQAMAALDAGEAALRALSDSRDVTISFAYTSKVELIRKILLECWQEHPEYIVRAALLPPDSALLRLTNAEIDFALVNQKIEYPGISYRAIASHDMYLYLGRGHPLSQMKEISLLDLKDTPFLCNDHTMKPELLRGICQSYGFTPDIRLVTSDTPTIQKIINQAPYGYFVRSNVIVYAMEKDPPTTGTFHLIKQKISSTDYLAIRNNFQMSLEQQHFLDRMRKTEAEFDRWAHEMSMQYMEKQYPK